MAIRHVRYLILLDFKKTIPASKFRSFTMRPHSTLRPKASSFNTEAEGGRMVKDWDFEAGIFFSKKIEEV